MKRIINFILFITIIAIGIFFVVVQKHKGFKPSTVVLTEQNPQKTYEQGLGDGFNKTVKYLHDKNYLTKDSIKIEIKELDSVLHSKIK
jgi:hypothetical protein